MKKSTALLSTLGLVLCTPINATPIAKPTSCPSLASIKAVGIQHVERKKVGEGWIAWSKNGYSTDEKWFFSILKVSGPNKNKAMNEARNKLNDLVTVYGPEKVEPGKWGCLYFSPNGHMEDMASAFTPPIM